MAKEERSFKIGPGLFFDLATLGGTLAVSFLVWSPVYQVAGPVDHTFLPGPTMAWLFFGAALTQIFGALLKAPGMQGRCFPHDSRGPFHFIYLRNWKVIGLLIAHLFLFLFLLILAINTPEAKKVFAPGQLPRILSWLLLFATALPTTAVAAALVVRFPPWPGPSALWEWAGNLLLIFSAVVIQAWFQENVLAHMALARIRDGDTLRPGDPASYGGLLGQLAVLFPMFLFLYLPPRLLFLIEDGHRRRSWALMFATTFLLWVFPFFMAPRWLP